MSTRRPRRTSADIALLPSCPTHLQGEARKEWRRTGRKLVECGLMTAIDATALALYCQAWARWIEAEANLSRFGVVIKSPSGFPIQSPYLAIANKAMEQMTRLLAEFGMSPSSRTRVATAAAVPEPIEQRQRDVDELDPRIRMLRETQ